mmetsp:Transcript_13119/g.40968  ORF Transcript_13119/g.40968 Transcript_13119/m.40968 type:complete len:217 (+) Transcript_13119:1153-1803(+)
MAEKSEARLVVGPTIDAANVEITPVGRQEESGHTHNLATEYTPVGAAELEPSVLTQVLHSRIVYAIILRQHHLNLVPKLADGTADRRHHIAQAANLGDWGHFHGNVHYVHWWLLFSRGSYGQVVVETIFVVIVGVLRRRVTEDEVHAPRVGGNKHLTYHMSTVRIRRLHCDRSPERTVLPAIPAATHIYSLASFEQRIAWIVVYLDGVTHAWLGGL